MARNRAGLHKEVSAIFDGVPIPSKQGTSQPRRAPGAGRLGGVPPQTSVAPPPRLPSPSRPPVPEPPKPAPVKQPEPKPVAKVEKGNPWQRKLNHIKSKLFAAKPGAKTGRQKAMVVMVPVLFVVLVMMISRAVITPSKSAAKTVSSESTMNVARATRKTMWERPEPYPVGLRDPMTAAAAGGQTNRTGAIVVSGIVYSEDKPSAVVNGRIVYEQDEVSGAVVTKINRDSVEFEMDGEKWMQTVHR